MSMTDCAVVTDEEEEDMLMLVGCWLVEFAALRGLAVREIQTSNNQSGECRKQWFVIRNYWRYYHRSAWTYPHMQK